MTAPLASSGGGDDASVVTVQPVALSPEQQSGLTKAWAYIDQSDAVALDLELTNIYSYTGYERELAQTVVRRWTAAGLDASYQPLDAHQGNALGRIRGSGDGPTLLVLCPSDTHWTGDPAQDGLQWGAPARRDATLPAVVEGSTVVGLGSDNVKGLCASVILAAESLQRSDLALRGSLVAALVAGAAPARAADSERRKAVSLGAGVRHLLAHGLAADFALYHKPGHQVSWQEVGLNQFRIRVSHEPHYMMRGATLIDAITGIARAFNDWAQHEYAPQGHGLWEPAAAINAINVGRPDKPNWAPAMGELYGDLRSAPGSSAADAARLLDQVMNGISADYPDVGVEWEMVATMPGGVTDPANWIVQSAIRAAQAIGVADGETYRGVPAGQTEMGLLQTLGIPSVSVRGESPEKDGFGRNPEMPADITQGFSLSGGYGPEIKKAAKLISYVMIDTLCRSRAEVGLD